MLRLLYKNLIFIVIFAFIFSSAYFVFSSQQEVIQSTVKISICGNNIKESGEACDSIDLAGKTCQDFGFTGGNLKCMPDCSDFDVSNCYSVTTTTLLIPPGGGGGSYTAPAETRVNFSGKAYPQSKITLLKDAQVVATTVAGADANFSISITGLSAGNYIFSVYGEDSKGNRSSLLTFPVGVTFGVIVNVTGIFIAPTIDVDKEEVRRGENIAIFGQSLPEANVTIQISSEEEIFVNTESDSDGVYLYNFGTEVLEYGGHFTKSKTAKEGDISPFSRRVDFLVGIKNVLKTTSVCGKADLNCDSRINLIDFSIAAYWYRRTLSDEFAMIERECLNSDGKIDLIDFSMMAYYWTG